MTGSSSVPRDVDDDDDDDDAVGERQKDEEQGQTIDVAKRGPLVITVRGQMWSPGIYRALRRAGRTLEQAWRGSFV